MPKRLPGFVQNAIGCSGGGALDPSHDFANRHERKNQEVDMIGHDYPSNQFVEVSLAVGDDQCFGN